jgi:glycine/D-amino acid oxidase-like deaminating enzyme
MDISKTSAVLINIQAVSPEFTTGAAGAATAAVTVAAAAVVVAAASWAHELVATVNATPAISPPNLSLLLTFMTFLLLF